MVFLCDFSIDHDDVDFVIALLHIRHANPRALVFILLHFGPTKKTYSHDSMIFSHRQPASCGTILHLPSEKGIHFFYTDDWIIFSSSLFRNYSQLHDKRPLTPKNKKTKWKREWRCSSCILNQSTHYTYFDREIPFQPNQHEWIHQKQLMIKIHYNSRIRYIKCKLKR